MSDSQSTVDLDELRKTIRLAIEPLIGQRVWGWGHVMGMLQLGFGNLHSVEKRFGQRKGTFQDTSDFILHVQTDWKIYRDDASVLEFGPDCFERADDEPYWNNNDDIPNGETSAASRLLLRSTIGLGEQTVEAIHFIEPVGLLIEITSSIEIRIEGPKFNGEEWRLFRTGTNHGHFLVQRSDEGTEIGHLQVSWH